MQPLQIDLQGMIALSAIWVALFLGYGNWVLQLYIAKQRRVLYSVIIVGGILLLAALVGLLYFVVGWSSIGWLLITALLALMATFQVRSIALTGKPVQEGEYHTIRLDERGISNWTAPLYAQPGFQTIWFPRGKVWLRNVLFEIATSSAGELLGVAVTPSQDNLPDVRTIPARVNSVVEVYVIITAGNAYKIEPTDKVKFEGKEIGRIELHFENEERQIQPLVLAEHIREWAHKSKDVVDTLSSKMTARNVWQSLDGVFVQDMLTIPVRGKPKRLEKISIIGEFEEAVTLDQGNFPTIQIAGITCRITKTH